MCVGPGEISRIVFCCFEITWRESSLFVGEVPKARIAGKSDECSFVVPRATSIALDRLLIASRSYPSVVFYYLLINNMLLMSMQRIFRYQTRLKVVRSAAMFALLTNIRI